VHHLVGREKIKGKSHNRGRGSARSDIETRRVEEGHISSNSNTGSRGSNSTGRRGPSNILRVGGKGNRNSIRERRPRGHVHTVKAPVHHREIGPKKEDQGLEVGH